MWVAGEVVFWTGMDVGEVAAASAGDEDLLAGAIGELDDENAAAAAAGVDGAHEAGGSCAEDEDVRFGHVLCRG